MLEEFRALGVPVHVVRTYTSIPSFVFSLLRIWFVRRDLMNFIDEHDIRCVLSPMAHLWSPLMIPTFKKKQLYFISTIHDPEPHLGDLISYPKFLIRREIKAANHTICLSKFVADRLQDLYGCSLQEISICPHGIFSFGGDYAQGAWPESNRPFYFLFFGRILPYKGLPLLLDAFRILKADGVCAELTIAGTGDVDAIAEKLNFSGIHAEIRWINENEVPAFYGKSDAVVLPYISASQSGVWGDAAAFSKPCVITPVAGLIEQVEDGINGVVASAVTTQSLADAMRRVMEPELYARLVKNLQGLDHRREWDFAAEKIVKLL